MLAYPWEHRVSGTQGGPRAAERDLQQVAVRQGLQGRDDVACDVDVHEASTAGDAVQGAQAVAWHLQLGQVLQATNARPQSCQAVVGCAQDLELGEVLSPCTLHPADLCVRLGLRWG